MGDDKKVNTALSYSSATLLNNCEQRYWHYKVASTPKDSDVEDDYAAFEIGKTFHEVLEKNLHTRDRLDDLLNEACKEYKTFEHQLMIKAMLWKYLDVHEASGLKCVACELPISSKEVIGFVDAFMADNRGNWWICDLKTAGRWYESTLAKLASDHQLNLYSHFAELMAGLLNLDPNKFKGCLYRVTTKTTISQKNNESDDAYLNRLYKTVKSFDISIPKEVMPIEEVWQRHLESYDRSIELRNGEAPKRNYNYCESYFRPCPYWSNCHGDINSKCGKKVVCNTAITHRNKNLAKMSIL